MYASTSDYIGSTQPFTTKTSRLQALILINTSSFPPSPVQLGLHSTHRLSLNNALHSSRDKETNLERLASEKRACFSSSI